MTSKSTSLSTPRTVSKVASETATTIADTRQAVLNPILELARSGVELLSIDYGPDTFLRELLRQSAK